jgi:hypothetical protein
MTPATNRTRILNPLERFSEIVFGLIMVLSFTGALSVAEVGREDIRIMLLGAIGCNLAWGIIDAAFYLISCLAERRRNVTILRSVQEATDPTHVQRIIADALPELVANALQSADFERMREHLRRLPAPTDWPRLTAENWRGALGVFLLVFLSTFPWLCRSSSCRTPGWRCASQMSSPSRCSSERAACSPATPACAAFAPASRWSALAPCWWRSQLSSAAN